MIIEYFYSHKSSPLHLITRSATVAAMAESVSTWSMRTPKTDSVWRVLVIEMPVSPWVNSWKCSLRLPVVMLLVFGLLDVQ